ncbi:MAG: DUF1385 domain-containing protein [Clostridium sp.]|nr:DUF1385 domain-containing protein [Clostridium sp.]MCM1399456.1 DUF1385 domain-containing protein [Clostridium sp.]
MGRVSIGGQAVLEGIMMKNDDKYAIAVRKPNKEIELKIETYKPAGKKSAILRAPIIRGVVNFVESMVIGVKTLTYSADFLEEEEEADNVDKETADDETVRNTGNDTKSDDLLMFGTVAFAIVLAVGLFMLLPAFLVSLIDDVVKNHFLLGLIEGIVRLAIFMAYVVIISKMEEINRTYMYHGAEHKCINCLEHGDDLTVENVLKHSRFHKRCGTSFLIIVMLVSILVFMCIKTDTVWLRLLSRVLLVPVIAGISYEFIKFAGRSESAFANILSKPGLWVQRFTTKEPDADMVEVAITAVEGVLDWRKYLEEQRGEQP